MEQTHSPCSISNCSVEVRTDKFLDVTVNMCISA